MYSLYTTCVDSSIVGEYGEDINEMVDSCHVSSIESKDFLNLAEKKGFKDNVLSDFSMSKDEFVSDFGIDCNSSYFQGHECLYVYFSAIEHIYIKNEDFSKLPTPDEAIKRREIIIRLTDQCEEITSEYSKDIKKVYESLLSFTKDNKEVFDNNSILLSSLGLSDYDSIVKKIDNDIFLNPEIENEMAATI